MNRTVIIILIIVAVLAIAGIAYMIYKNRSERETGTGNGGTGTNTNTGTEVSENVGYFLTGDAARDELVIDNGIECAKKIIYKDMAFISQPLVGFPKGNDKTLLMATGLISSKKYNAIQLLNRLKTTSRESSEGEAGEIQKDRDYIKQNAIGQNVCYVILRYLLSKICPLAISHPGTQQAMDCFDLATQATFGKG